MNKIIFLDIDGVMNSSSGKPPYFSDMELVKISLLRKLVKESHALGIVITSARRYSEFDMKDKLEVFSFYEIPVLGVTRFRNLEVEDDNRGKEIYDYIVTTRIEIDKIVIIDDNDDGISDLFCENFILVNRYEGLNEDIYEKAMKVLS